MKRRALILLALTGGASAAAAAPPQFGRASLSAYATLTSDHRERGLSQSGGDPALLLGLDYQHRTGFFTGLSGAFGRYGDDSNEGYERGGQGAQAQSALALRGRSELELYAGYNWRNAIWSATAAYSRYLYPQSAFDYAYNERGAGFGFRDRVFVTLSYTPALFARGPSALEAEAAFNFPFDRGITFGGTLGRVDSDAFAGGRYTEWNLGASKTAGPLTLDLRFYDNDARGGNFYGAPLPDKWVLSLSYGFSTR
ncbi:MAG TPA: TorF family putative porin [Gammaproteobacteria bacterium]|nr:TorF family putative porin [Gammaproteobacteria bacterium]